MKTVLPTEINVVGRKNADVVMSYYSAKNAVLCAGYKDEIAWQDSLCFENVEEIDFLREYAWVVLSTGMRESVIRRLFHEISDCFFDWESSKRIAEQAETCYQLALRKFNHPGKIAAIVSTAQLISSDGFDAIKKSIQLHPIYTLQSLPFIGPTTSYHLAKNLGLPFAKPDRHLVRIARAAGFSDVEDFCRYISLKTGDRIQVVDIVLWRFATIEKSYLSFFSKASY